MHGPFIPLLPTPCHTIHASFRPSITKLVLFGFIVIVFYMLYGVHLYSGVLNRACYWTVGPMVSIQIMLKHTQIYAACQTPSRSC